MHRKQSVALVASSKMDSKDPDDVDSRDNPFLPGGNLSKEAEDILARATIIRDTFILKDNEGANTGSNVKDTSGAHAPVEEPMTANVAGSTEASPPSAASGNTAAAPKSNINDVKPKENGQLETDSSLTPVNEKVVDPDKNKKKHQKCCLIM